MCEIDEPVEIPDTNDKPPNNACGALAAGFAKSCVANGGNRAACAAKSTILYITCISGGF